MGVEALSQLPGGNVTAPWSAWLVSPNGRNQTAGYLERHEAFDFATVKGAGHEAPGFQPYASRELIRAFLSNSLGSLVEAAAPHLAAGGASSRGGPSRASQGAALAAAIARGAAAKRAGGAA